MSQSGKEDGRASYIYIRDLCLPQDSDSQHAAEVSFIMELRIKDNEKVQRLHERFDLAYKTLLHTGRVKSQTESSINIYEPSNQ
jgi:hypothetical protein